MNRLKYFEPTLKNIPLKILLILLIIPTILVSVWFREGYIMGTGESGLPFYDLKLEFNNFHTSWANFALGHPSNIVLASKETYHVLSLVQDLGIPAFLIQAVFFWLVFIISGVSIFLLANFFFPRGGVRHLRIS